MKTKPELLGSARLKAYDFPATISSIIYNIYAKTTSGNGLSLPSSGALAAKELQEIMV